MGNVFCVRPALRKKVLKIDSFTSPGSFQWTVPAGVTAVDVFLVGGGGAGGSGHHSVYVGGGGGGGGECVTQKGFAVVAGQTMSVIVGASRQNSTFGSLTARAGRDGGPASRTSAAGGVAWPGSGAGGSVALSGAYGLPQHGTVGDVRCRDFGEPAGALNAGGGGGGGSRSDSLSGIVGGYFGGSGGATGTTAGSGAKGQCVNHPQFNDGGGGGGGYGGGGGGGTSGYGGGAGGHGKVLIRYWGYE